VDYKSLMQSVKGMNDQQLLLAEKKISEERQRRAVLAAGHAIIGGTDPGALIDLDSLANGIREKLRVAMSLCPEAALVSVLDQTRDHRLEYSEDVTEEETLEVPGEQEFVMELLACALTAAVVHEARCEAKRRLDTVR